MTGSNSGLTDKNFTAAGIVLILFALCVTWSIPRGSGDLYISLAAGRDVLAGKLGAPDDWSFSTNGRIWINQNWGADVILYLAASAFGGTGLLAVKFILLFLSALFLFLALRERKIEPLVNLAVTSVIMIAVNGYAILRPNLFTLPLTALELWLLFKSAKKLSLLWAAVAVVLFWANVHAGFIFGLGMLFLWAVCLFVPELWRKKPGAFRRGWQLPAAVAAALILAGLVNPFGLKNLTLPFTMLGGSEWNVTRDWLPIWKSDVLEGDMSSILIYIGLVCTTLLLAGLRPARTLLRKKTRDENGQDARIVLFETLLALVTLAMTVLSNRFIILALTALAPLLAGRLAWLCRMVRYQRLPLFVFSGFVIVYGTLVLCDTVRSYDPNNPVSNTGTGTLFEKMHYTNGVYDKALCDFINANRIGGNVVSPWQWEGYLRWNCPRLKPFIGGRAQQIYGIEALNLYMYISGYDVPAYRGKAPQAVLDEIDAHYLITGNSSGSEHMFLTVMNSPDWVIVYADTRFLLFANTRHRNAAAVADLFTEDNLIFKTEAVRAMSKAAGLLSRPAGLRTETLLGLFAEAWKNEPVWLWSYWILYNNLGFNADFLRELVRLMNEQLVRLEAMSPEGPDADLILQCRIYLSSVLAEYAKTHNSPAVAAERKRSLETARRIEAALYEKWKPIIR